MAADEAVLGPGEIFMVLKATPNQHYAGLR
jgi:hypothetical protein